MRTFFALSLVVAAAALAAAGPQKTLFRRFVLPPKTTTTTTPNEEYALCAMCFFNNATTSSWDFVPEAAPPPTNGSWIVLPPNSVPYMLGTTVNGWAASAGEDDYFQGNVWYNNYDVTQGDGSWSSYIGMADGSMAAMTSYPDTDAAEIFMGLIGTRAIMFNVMLISPHGLNYRAHGGGDLDLVVDDNTPVTTATLIKQVKTGLTQEYTWKMPPHRRDPVTGAQLPPFDLSAVTIFNNCSQIAGFGLTKQSVTQGSWEVAPTQFIPYMYNQTDAQTFGFAANGDENGEFVGSVTYTNLSNQESVILFLTLSNGQATIKLTFSSGITSYMLVNDVGQLAINFQVMLVIPGEGFLPSPTPIYGKPPNYF